MKEQNKENKMKLRIKATIFLAAVLLTFVGFNLIASPAAVDLAKIGKKAGYKIIANVLAEADTATHQSPLS